MLSVCFSRALTDILHYIVGRHHKSEKVKVPSNESIKQINKYSSDSI